MTKGRFALGSIAALALTASACGGSACPSSDQVRAELAAAASGSTTTVPDGCMLSGSFVVPAGATLHGGTFALAADDGITLTPSSGAIATALESATIVGGSAQTSVLVRGAGQARVSNVTIDAQRGYGIGVSGATVAIDHVSMMGTLGSLDLAQIGELGVPADRTQNFSYGIVAIDGATVDVSTGDFGQLSDAAVICSGASITLSDLTIEGNRGFGVTGYDCTMSASHVDVTGMVAGGTLPGVGIGVFDGSTMMQGDRLSVHDEPGYGVLIDASSATLTSPAMSGLGVSGVWAEAGASLTLSDGTFDGNRGIAIAAIGANSVDVRATQITSTMSASLPTMGGLGTTMMADAIHVVQSSEQATSVMLAGLTLTNNARVGLLIDGGGAPLTLSIADTMVNASGTELGAIAQHVASLPSNWDSGIRRSASATTLDASAPSLVVTQGLGTNPILMPPTSMALTL